MSKEEILKQIEELEQEAKEIEAEQANIDHMLSLVSGGRLDAYASHIAKLQSAVNARYIQWSKKADILSAEANKLVA